MNQSVLQNDSLKVELLEVEVDTTRQKTDNLDKFIAKVKKITEPKALTPDLVHEFIERIIVYKPYRENEKRYQQIDICYSGVGIVNVPSAVEMEMLFQKHIASRKEEKPNKQKTA